LAIADCALVGEFGLFGELAFGVSEGAVGHRGAVAALAAGRAGGDLEAA
jgi:hypothetical protein